MTNIIKGYNTILTLIKLLCFPLLRKQKSFTIAVIGQALKKSKLKLKSSLSMMLVTAKVFWSLRNEVKYVFAST